MGLFIWLAKVFALNLILLLTWKVLDMDVVNATVLKLDELKEWLGPSKPGF